MGHPGICGRLRLAQVFQNEERHTKSMEEVLQPANLSFLMQYPGKKDRSYCRTTAGRCCRRWCTRYWRAWIEVILLMGRPNGCLSSCTQVILWYGLSSTQLGCTTMKTFLSQYRNDYTTPSKRPYALLQKVEVDVCTSKKTCMTQAIHFYRWSTLVTTKRSCRSCCTGGASLRPLGCPIPGVEEANRPPFTRVITEGAGYGFKTKYPDCSIKKCGDYSTK